MLSRRSERSPISWVHGKQLKKICNPNFTTIREISRERRRQSRVEFSPVLRAARSAMAH